MEWFNVVDWQYPVLSIWVTLETNVSLDKCNPQANLLPTFSKLRILRNSSMPLSHARPSLFPLPLPFLILLCFSLQYFFHGITYIHSRSLSRNWGSFDCLRSRTETYGGSSWGWFKNSGADTGPYGMSNDQGGRRIPSRTESSKTGEKLVLHSIVQQYKAIFRRSSLGVHPFTSLFPFSSVVL